MTYRILVPALVCGSLLGQAPASKPDFTPDTVLAIIDGHKLTYGEIETYLDGLGPERKTQALASPRELVNQYALQKKLVELAEKEKLDQKSPYKEALEVSRRALMTEAELNYKSLNILVTADDQKKFYDSHKDRYTEVKLQVIYLGFTSDEAAKENPKKYRNEAQALALATKIKGEAKSSDDWRRLVAQYSEDEASKAKFGEYGVIKASDKVPPEIHEAVFALKAEEVSAPVKQQNGFYLFRAESIGLRPYDQVKDEIYSELKDIRMKEWMDQTQKSISVKVENEQFFAAPPAPKH